MMLCRLSLKNIRKSFKDYAIYFVTLILGVAIFYVFNAIESQTVMMNVSSDTREIIQLMTNILSGVSVFVSFVLGFLIIYASRFLIKRRNKEFGIYLTLGMSKRKISVLLFFETLFIGIISLIVGLGVGIMLSQFFSVLVANMFEADLTRFTFSFSIDACVKTLIYFGIMYLMVMIFNVINIGKCKLIDLLYASRKSEKVKLKNPYLCIVIFIVASVSLGYAYYLVTDGISELQDARQILEPIIIGSVSTFFIFFSLSGLILRIVMWMKSIYYKGLNSFVLRQISSKINTTVMSMTVICLMLFVTICVFSSALSIKNSMTSNLKTLAPVDVEFSKALNLEAMDVEGSWRYTSDMIDDSRIGIRETLDKMDFDVDKYLTDVVSFDIYSSSDVTLRETLGSYYDESVEQYSMLDYDSNEAFVRVSDYNKLARLYGLEEFSLDKNQYILVTDYQEFIDIREEALKRNTKISLLGRDYYPKYKENKKGFLDMNSTHANAGFFIVPDDALNDTMKKGTVLAGNYNTNYDREEIEKMIVHGLENHSYNQYTGLEVRTKDYLYQASVGLGAMVTFIGLYLGIIFLISSAAILALKELSDSTDNRNRFMMLRKIGVDEKLINQALFKQIGIFFLFPLVVAIIHSIFGIRFCNFILSVFGNEKLLPSIIMTAIFMIVIYGGYFLVTYFCSKNIIRERS